MRIDASQCEVASVVKASQSCCGQPWFEKRESKDGYPIHAISGAGVGNRFLAIKEMFFLIGRTGVKRC